MNHKLRLHSAIIKTLSLNCAMPKTQSLYCAIRKHMSFNVRLAALPTDDVEIFLTLLSDVQRKDEGDWNIAAIYTVFALYWSFQTYSPAKDNH